MKDLKKCVRCKEEKPLEEYYRRGAGIRGKCKSCMRELAKKAHAKKNPPVKKKYYNKERDTIQPYGFRMMHVWSQAPLIDEQRTLKY